MDPKSLCENFNCKIEETKEGVQINITPKDPAKAESLKSLVTSWKDLFDCKC
jgi:hypothetical protein